MRHTIYRGQHSRRPMSHRARTYNNSCGVELCAHPRRPYALWLIGRARALWSSAGTSYVPCFALKRIARVVSFVRQRGPQREPIASPCAADAGGKISRNSSKTAPTSVYRHIYVRTGVRCILRGRLPGSVVLNKCNTLNGARSETILPRARGPTTIGRKNQSLAPYVRKWTRQRVIRAAVLNSDETRQNESIFAPRTSRKTFIHHRSTTPCSRKTVKTIFHPAK